MSARVRENIRYGLHLLTEGTLLGLAAVVLGILVWAVGPSLGHLAHEAISFHFTAHRATSSVAPAVSVPDTQITSIDPLTGQSVVCDSCSISFTH